MRKRSILENLLIVVIVCIMTQMTAFGQTTFRKVGDMLKSVYDSNNDGVIDLLATHTANTSNPHSVTKAQVGLANVDNTSDANKPLSTAATNALANKSDTTHGHTEYANATNATNHYANTSNPHSVTKAQVGLTNASDTSDANKPVSTAQQTALNLKGNLSGGNTWSGNQTITGILSVNSTPGVPTIFPDIHVTNTTLLDGAVSGAGILASERAALSAGAGISYNNTTGVINSTITQYTDTNARAAANSGLSITLPDTSTWNGGNLSVFYPYSYTYALTNITAITNVTGSNLNVTVSKSNAWNDRTNPGNVITILLNAWTNGTLCSYNTNSTPANTSIEAGTMIMFHYNSGTNSTLRTLFK